MVRSKGEKVIPITSFSTADSTNDEEDVAMGPMAVPQAMKKKKGKGNDGPLRDLY